MQRKVTLQSVSILISTCKYLLARICMYSCDYCSEHFSDKFYLVLILKFQLKFIFYFTLLSYTIYGYILAVALDVGNNGGSIRGGKYWFPLCAIKHTDDGPVAGSESYVLPLSSMELNEMCYTPCKFYLFIRLIV
jgi:hypothetical protein